MLQRIAVIDKAARIMRRVRVVETLEVKIQGLQVTFQKKETRDLQRGGISSIAQVKVLWAGTVHTLPGLKPMGCTYEACYRDAEQLIDTYLHALQKGQWERNYVEIYTVGEAIYGNLWTTLAARVFQCLIGSTRFEQDFAEANLRETLAGNIALTIAWDSLGEADMQLTPDIKSRLDELQLRRIEMADEVLILNRDGYVGESTLNEIQHARSLGKVLRWLEPEYALDF
jgi:hypothetical protein